MMEHIKRFRVALGIALALALAACASVQQAVQAYGSVAVTNARAANDTLIEAYKVSVCALPLSAIARHPEMVASVRSLCLAPSDPVAAQLLQDIEKQAGQVPINAVAAQPAGKP